MKVTEKTKVLVKVWPEGKFSESISKSDFLYKTTTDIYIQYFRVNEKIDC